MVKLVSYLISDKCKVIPNLQSLMKPYGLPRTDDVANPDVADIKRFGLVRVKS